MKYYDYRGLIHAYMMTQKHHVHPDFERYYQALLAKLEEAFGIALSDTHIYQNGAPSSAQAYWVLFRSAVRSYLTIQSPWESMLENGALMHRLISEEGKIVLAYTQRIAELSRESQHNHMELIYHLFWMMYGEIDTVVNSDDLAELGLDDSTEPQMKDYYDYL